MAGKRRGYKQYEARLIQLLKWRFEKAKLKVDGHLKVGKLPLEIDLIVNRRAIRKIRGSSSLPRLFEYFKRYNVMELKTEQDPLRLAQIAGLYLAVYAEAQNLLGCRSHCHCNCSSLDAGCDCSLAGFRIQARWAGNLSVRIGFSILSYCHRRLVGRTGTGRAASLFQSGTPAANFSIVSWQGYEEANNGYFD